MPEWCAPGLASLQVAQEEAGNASLEVRSQLAVAAPVHELELGPRVAGERLPQPLGVANGDLLVLATVDDQHRNAQTGRRGGGRRARGSPAWWRALRSGRSSAGPPAAP